MKERQEPGSDHVSNLEEWEPGSDHVSNLEEWEPGSDHVSSFKDEGSPDGTIRSVPSVHEEWEPGSDHVSSFKDEGSPDETIRSVPCVHEEWEQGPDNVSSFKDEILLEDPSDFKLGLGRADETIRSVPCVHEEWEQGPDNVSSFKGEGSPVFILVRPQLGQNIGAAARAMLNCGLTRLRLVAPRDPWPNEAAWATGAGADQVLKDAQIFSTVPEAVADLSYVYATTARPRDLIKEVVSPSRAAVTMAQQIRGGESVGILFGSERSGLENQDIGLATQLITIPVNPHFSSLNLSQSVLLLAHGYFLQIHTKEERIEQEFKMGKTRLAKKKEIGSLVSKVIQIIQEKHPSLETPRSQLTWLNLENFLNRCPLTFQDVQSLHRVVHLLSTEAREDLEKPPLRPAP
jgi:tRNA/rRNA methyltransferase